jgi:predicted permease
MFMNSGFIGFPLALFAFGSAGLNIALIFNMANALLLFTVGIYIVSQKKDPWQVLKVPYLYASFIGLGLSLGGIRLPQAIYSPIYILGGTTIPLALFMLGCRLAEIKVIKLKLPLVVTVLRLGLGLALGFLAVFVFRLSGLAAKIVILSASLSSAATNLALAEEYDSEPELVASSIAVSTLVSFVLIIFLLNWLI